MTSLSKSLADSQLDFSETSADLKPSIFIKRWKIDVHYFFVFAIFATLLGLFIDPGQETSLRGYLLWMTARGVSMAGLYLFWKLITKILEKNHLSPMPLWQILLVGAAGGALQSVLFEVFIWLFLLPGGSTHIIRMTSAAFFAAIWLPAQSVTVINFTKFRRKRESIQDELLQLETVEQARKRLQLLDEDILRKQIGNLVGKSQVSASKVLEGALKNKSAKNLPDIARGLASDHLRVLAHEISELSTYSELKKRWWVIDQKFSTSIGDAIFKSLRTRPLNKEWFLLVLTATISLPLFRQLEWQIALTTVVVAAISSYAIQSVGFFFYLKFPSHAVVNTIFVTLCTIVIPLFLVSFVPGNTPTLKNRIAYFISVLLVTCFGHLAQAGLLQQKELLLIQSSALQKAKAENAEINFELARITKDWAEHIHGNIQSRLHAYALVLEQAQLRDDSEGVERAIEEITRTIKELDREQAESMVLALENEVVATCELWSGIIDVDLHIQKDIRTLKEPIVSDINRCLIEAITNSVRHGHADSMKVSLEKAGDLIRLEIKDNGVGFTKISKGLGSKTFESSTRRNWSLVRSATDNETTLTLNFDLNVPRVGVEPTLGGF